MNVLVYLNLYLKYKKLVRRANNIVAINALCGGRSKKNAHSVYAKIAGSKKSID